MKQNIEAKQVGFQKIFFDPKELTIKDSLDKQSEIFNLVLANLGLYNNTLLPFEQEELNELRDLSNVRAIFENPIKLRRLFANYSTIVRDEIVRNNVNKAIQIKAENELASLQSKKDKLTPNEIEKLYNLKVLSSLFVQYDQIAFKPNNLNLSFNAHEPRLLTDIHSSSVACGGISGAMGEGAAIGGDTFFLHLVQGTMFSLLAKTLDASFTSAALHASIEFGSGSVIGVTLARVLVGWLGIAGHAASAVGTAGAGNVAVSGAVRSINGILSTGITEKMGWGFVKRVQNGSMNLKDQIIRLAGLQAASIVTEGAEAFLHHNIKIDNIKAILDALPQGAKEFSTEVIKYVGKNGGDKISSNCLAQFSGFLTEKTIEKASEGKLPSSKDIKNSLLMSVISVSVGEFLSKQPNNEMTENIQLKTKEYTEKLMSSPIVFRKFEEEIIKYDLSASIDDMHHLHAEDIEKIAKFSEKIVYEISNELEQKQKANQLIVTR